MDAQYLDVVQLNARQLLPPIILPNPLDPTRPLSIGIPTPTIVRPTTPTTTTRSTTTTTSSSSTTSESSSSTTTSVTTSPSPTPSTTDSVVQTPVNPQTSTHTVTAAGDAATTSPVSPPQSAPTGFLQNKVLSGVVFGIVGLVVLVLLIILGTCVVRRRRNKRLMREAINFDPVVAGTAYAEALEESKADAEKGRTSDSTSGHGHGGASWTTTPLPGQSNAYAFGPSQGPTQGQPYIPPSSWSTPAANPNARYLPPSQLYRNPEAANYPAANTSGY